MSDTTPETDNSTESSVKTAKKTRPDRSRSLGLKLLLVGALVILLGVPLGFVNFLAWERAGRAEQVAAEIGDSYGGPQSLRGPFLILPVTVTRTQERRENGETITDIITTEETLVVSPERLSLDIGMQTETLRRAIYDVPVYNAVIGFEGQFVVPDVSDLIPDNGVINWDRAQILVSVADLRGIDEELVFQIDGADPLVFEPDSGFSRASPEGVPRRLSTHSGHEGAWRVVSAPIEGVNAQTQFTFTGELGLSGAQVLRVIASGRDTRATITGDWAHPGFTGDYLPDERAISSDGFTASWQVPYLARGIPGVWREGDGFALTQVDQSAFSVRLVTPTDGYVRVSRSLKYALFFVGFSLLMVFLVEASQAVRVHAAQYILIGLAQVVFYLLLLAFSEHFLILMAYLLSAGATILLTAAYAGAIFKSRRFAMLIGAVLILTYGLQYMLLLLEDYALLIGALLAFAAIAITMWVTRNVDWYALNQKDEADQTG